MERRIKSQSSFTKGNYRKFKAVSFYGSKLIRPRKNFHLPPFVWKIMLCVCLLLVISYLVFWSSYFKVTDIIIQGNHYVGEDRIRSSIPKNQNIFLFDQRKYKKELLAQVTEIKDVQIYRGIPNALKIVILERDGRAIWQSGDKKFLISSQGEAMRQIGTEEVLPDLPLIVDKKNFPISLGQSLVSPSFIAFISNLKDSFFDATNIKPTNFEINETTFDVILNTEAGFYIKFDSLRSSKKQLDNLKIVLASKRQDIHEYIDLRIDGWAYYK
jgi:hypothetical protein